MPSGDAVDYKWYQYTDDDSNTWSVKVDKTWGDDTDSGLGAYSTADPVLNWRSRTHPRFCTMIDPATGRTKRLIAGTAACNAWTTANFTQTGKFRGLAGDVTFSLVSRTKEKIRRAGAIVNKAEPSTA